MRWQDVVIATAQVGFIFAMIPSIKGQNKPASLTSIVNTILVSVIAICLLTLKLWFSAITAAIIAITWAILATQKISQK